PVPSAEPAVSGESSPAGVFLAPDPDDSWHADAARGTAGAVAAVSPDAQCALDGGGTMIWEKSTPLRENCEAPLRFKVIDAEGKPVALQPYMGMLGHAAIRRDDGS